MTGGAVAVAADHAGFDLKEHLRAALTRAERRVVDLGTHDAEPIDYPDVAERLARCLERGEADLGVLVCGSGIGVAIAANRYPWIRAAACHDVTAARLARAHNDANVLTLGARLVGTATADDILDVFIDTPFAGGRHAQRVAKLGAPPRPT